MRKGEAKEEESDRVATVSWNLRRTIVKCAPCRIYYLIKIWDWFSRSSFTFSLVKYCLGFVIVYVT